MEDIVLRMKTLPDLTNEKAWQTIYEGAREIERLRDENCILRAALSQFVEMPEKFPEDQFLDGWARMRSAFKNAKAVLQPQT